MAERRTHTVRYTVLGTILNTLRHSGDHCDEIAAVKDDRDVFVDVDRGTS
jgi:hypothetical protein